MIKVWPKGLFEPKGVFPKSVRSELSFIPLGFFQRRNYDHAGVEE